MTKELAQKLRCVYDGIMKVPEKKRFGDLGFVVDGHMSFGFSQSDLMVRIGLKKHAEALTRSYARDMAFTGKPLRGFVYVSQEGLESDVVLQSWVPQILDFVTTLPPKA